MKKTEKTKKADWFENPFEKLERMDEAARGMMNRAGGLRTPENFPRARASPISVDMGQTKNELLVRAEIPGFKKDEVRFKVTPTTMDIIAEKKKELIEKDGGFFRQEKSFGSARRFLSFPVEVEPEKGNAKIEDGVLEITLPKKAKRPKVEQEQ